MDWLLLLQPYVLGASVLVLLLLRRWSPWVRCVLYIAICVLACWRLGEYAKNGPAMIQDAAMRIGMQYAPEILQSSVPAINSGLRTGTEGYNTWVVPGANYILRPFGRAIQPKAVAPQLPTPKKGPWWHAFMAFDLGFSVGLLLIVCLDFTFRLARFLVLMFPHFWGWFFGKKTLPV